MPHSMAPRVNTEQTRKVSFAHLHFCVPYVPVNVVLNPFPAYPLHPSVLSASLGS